MDQRIDHILDYKLIAEEGSRYDVEEWKIRSYLIALVNQDPLLILGFDEHNGHKFSNRYWDKSIGANLVLRPKDRPLAGILLLTAAKFEHSWAHHEAIEMTDMNERRPAGNPPPDSPEKTTPKCPTKSNGMPMNFEPAAGNDGGTTNDKDALVVVGEAISEIELTDEKASSVGKQSPAAPKQTWFSSSKESLTQLDPTSDTLNPRTIDPTSTLKDPSSLTNYALLAQRTLQDLPAFLTFHLGEKTVTEEYAILKKWMEWMVFRRSCDAQKVWDPGGPCETSAKICSTSIGWRRKNSNLEPASSVKQFYCTSTLLNNLDNIVLAAHNRPSPFVQMSQSTLPFAQIPDPTTLLPGSRRPGPKLPWTCYCLSLFTFFHSFNFHGLPQLRTQGSFQRHCSQSILTSLHLRRHER